MEAFVLTPLYGRRRSLNGDSIERIHMDYFLGWKVLSNDNKALSKILWAGGLTMVAGFVPFGGIIMQMILMGWMSQSIRHSHLSGTRLLLPFEWDTKKLFGDYLTQGARVFGAQLIWTGPLLIPIMIGVFGAIIAAIGAGASGDEDLFLPIMLAAFAFMFLMMLLGFLLSPFVVAASLRVMMTEQFGDTWKWREHFGFGKKNYVLILIASVILGFIGMGIALAGFMALIVGVYFAMPVVMVFQHFVHLQVYEQHLQSGGEAFPVKSDDAWASTDLSHMNEAVGS